ncbi:MAG: low-specificity L-threonine aldolase [Pseudomonadota bacterium]
MYDVRTIAPSTTGTNSSVIDLRSDTVTRPSDAMREAMASAEVGDDVYGDDPTVHRLEDTAAQMLGKEAGLLVPSGTQSNLIALLTHCGRGEEYISGQTYHIAYYEAGGAAVLGGISPWHLPVGPRHEVTAEAVEHAIKADDIHHPVTRLVCLENTAYGHVQDQHVVERIAAVAREKGLSLHLDGARLMNASVKSGNKAADLAAPFDTVSLCLSKGLGAPVGSILCGSHAFINRARRNRKMVGGGMRQAGVLAAAGLYALENNIERLAEDHRRASELAAIFGAYEEMGVDESRLETNMLFLTPRPEIVADLKSHFQQSGIILSGKAPTMRLVTHLDIDDLSLEKIASVLAAYFDRAQR